MSRAKKKPEREPEDDEIITPINKMEILPLGTGMKLIRLDLPVSVEFLEVLTELSKIKQLDLKRYVTEALNDTVDTDLASPNEIGMDVCKNLKEIIHPEGET